VSVGEHQSRIAQRLHLNRIVFGEVVADGGDHARGKTMVVQRNLVLVFAHIAVDDAAADFDEQPGVVKQAVELLAHISVSGRLPERVAEKADPTKAPAGQLFVQGHQHHRLVLSAVAEMVGVGRKSELAPVCWLRRTWHRQDVGAVAVAVLSLRGQAAAQQNQHQPDGFQNAHKWPLFSESGHFNWPSRQSNGAAPSGQKVFQQTGQCLGLVVVHHVPGILDHLDAGLRHGFQAFVVLGQGVGALPPLAQ